MAATLRRFLYMDVSASGVFSDSSDDGAALQIGKLTIVDDGGGIGIDAGSTRIVNVAAPQGANDAANKAYVDGVATGIDWKDSVRVASTANVTVASPGASIDTIALSAGDRVLLKNQATGAENGIYVWNGAAVPMTRSADAVAGNLTSGAAVFVSEGSTNADTGWTLNTNDPITVGTTAQTWTQFTSVGSVNPGAGLTANGLTLDVVANADGSIVVNANDVQVGVLATDAQHGARGGGTQHAVAVAGTSAGFMSAADKTKLDGIATGATANVGTVTSVAALTIGTAGTDLGSTVANGTTTPVITLNIPTASASNRGALSSSDWTTFNNKQAALVSGTNIKTLGGASLLGSGDFGTLGIPYGGTGQTTANAAYNALSPNTTNGDITYRNATVNARLAGNGTATKMFLSMTSSVPSWGAIQAADVPTLNQNTTGTAANVTGTVAIANGGTGQTTAQAAIDALLAGTKTAGLFARANGTNVVLGSIQAGDVPTLNQNTTGSSASCTGNALTATTLQNARTINGVSFNGSANINVPTQNSVTFQNSGGDASGTTFNGSAARTIGPTTIGAALASHVGLTVTAGAGGLAKGDPVYVSAANTALKGDPSNDTKSVIVGLASAAISAAAQGTIQQSGVLTGVGSGWTPGVPVFLSSALGLTQDPVGGITSRHRTIMVGVAVNATDLAVSIRDHGKKP